MVFEGVVGTTGDKVRQPRPLCKLWVIEKVRVLPGRLSDVKR